MIIFTSNTDSGFGLDKFADLQRANKALEILAQINSSRMTKTASSGQNSESATSLLIRVLSSMGLNVNIDIGELLRKLSENQEQMVKEAKSKDSSCQEVIKIASKDIKDSHYDIDVCKNRITKNGTSLIMVSAYMKEAYLGRYLIKRNYYFIESNSKDSDYIYADLIEKFNRIKTRYHDGKISSKEIFIEAKSLLDATKGDLSLDDNSDIGTTVRRDTTTGHELNGPMYSESIPKG
jgi:GMP synthase PP-ATPase subunit